MNPFSMELKVVKLIIVSSGNLAIGAANVYKLKLELYTIQCIVNNFTPLETFGLSQPQCLQVGRRQNRGSAAAQLMLIMGPSQILQLTS